MRADTVFRGGPEQLRAALEACGAREISVGERGFPVGLEPLSDPVAGLYVRGDAPAELVPAVAIVGARTCSRTGVEVARSLARGLARAGVVVVSGAARGIDSAGHEGALDAGGRTIAVLGSGIDVDYPRRNRELLARIAAQGAVVSEYPPGVPAEPYRFPARNRIIAALSRAVVIVEGGASSGSLITCRRALDLGREVFAVPGPVTSPLSEASHALVRDGARLIRSSEDLLADLGLAGTLAVDHQAPSAPPLPLLSLAEEQVLGYLTGPTLAEHVADQLGWPIAQVVPALMQLEIKGVVRSIGGRYERRFEP